MNTNKVMVATDLSDGTASAATWAHSYAQLTDVKVAVVHVIEVSVPNWLRDAYTVPDDPSRRAQVEAQVSAWYKSHTGVDPDEVILVVGAPDQALKAAVEAHDPSLLVISRTGKTRLRRILVGSTAKMLVATPPCPVVVVHPDQATLQAGSDIVVATDLTTTAESAIVSAALLAKVAGDTLDIVHAKRPATTSLVAYDEVVDMLTEGSYDEATNEQFQKILANHQGELAGLNYRTHIVDDTPTEAILNLAEDKNAAVIVLGNAAHYNLITNLFGRVSVRVMEHASCTVAVVPPGSRPLADADEEE